MLHISLMVMNRLIQTEAAILFYFVFLLLPKNIANQIIYANMSVQYTAIFHGCKNDNFQMKFFDIFISQ